MLSRIRFIIIIFSIVLLSGCILDNGVVITPTPDPIIPDPVPIGKALDTQNPVLKVYGKNNQYVILHFNDQGFVCVYDANGKLLEVTGDRAIGGIIVSTRDKYFDDESSIKSQFNITGGKYNTIKDAPEKHNTEVIINKEVKVDSELNVTTSKKKELTYEEAMERNMKEYREKRDREKAQADYVKNHAIVERGIMKKMIEADKKENKKKHDMKIRKLID